VDFVEAARRLWSRKLAAAIVLVAALLAAMLVSYRVGLAPPELRQRSLQIGAASSQILVDTPDSTLVSGATPEKFDTLAARARVYGEYLSTLQARARISEISGVPAASLTTSGPFSPESGQVSYQNQTSASRGGEILKEGASNRLVFVAQEGIPIINVDAQAADASTAIRLAHASFITLRQYVRGLQRSAADGRRDGEGVIVRQLGAPEGGTIGGSNNRILMALAFLLVSAVGFVLILALPQMAERWRRLAEADRPAGPATHARATALPLLGEEGSANGGGGASGASVNGADSSPAHDRAGEAPARRTA
jgi:hypothetical protein